MFLTEEKLCGGKITLSMVRSHLGFPLRREGRRSRSSEQFLATKQAEASLCCMRLCFKDGAGRDRGMDMEPDKT